MEFTTAMKPRQKENFPTMCCKSSTAQWSRPGDVLLLSFDGSQT
jgi:hypothetical protein